MAIEAQDYHASSHILLQYNATGSYRLSIAIHATNRYGTVLYSILYYTVLYCTVYLNILYLTTVRGTVQ